MSKKQIIKITIDILMTAFLILLMSFQVIGQQAHEWLGAGMAVLFILHNLLNLKWYKNLFKGKYTPLHTVQTIINALMLCSITGLILSGIMMSRHVFDFLPFRGGMSFARLLHMAASYWSFMLMSIHLGMHWGMIMGIIRKVTKQSVSSKNRSILLRITAAAIAIYGAYAFYQADLASYMFLRKEFVFYDFEKKPIIVFAEYITMIGLWAFLGHYSAKGLQYLKKKI